MAKSDGKPSLKPRVAPRGVGDSLTWSVMGAGLARRLRQHPSGTIPLRTLALMRKDAQIGLALRLAKSIFHSAGFWVECADPAEEALYGEVIVEGLLPRLLQSSLLAYDFGFSPHELVWKVGDVSVTWGRGADHGEREFRGLYLPHAAREIDPARATVLFEPETFRFAGLEIAQAGSTFELRPESCFVFTNQKEFGDWYGTPRQEPAYDPWHDGQLLRFFRNVYFERSGAPQMKAFIPTDQETFDASGNPIEDPLTYYAAELPEVVRSSSIIVLPGDIDPETRLRKWDIEYLRLDSRGTEFRDQEAYLDVLKMRGVLVPERVATQEKGTGTHGMVESQTRTFFDTADWDLGAFVSDVNEHLLPTFRRLNDLPGRARLKTTGVSRGAESLLLSVFQAISQAEAMATSQGLPPAILNDTIAKMVDAERLLRNMEVPVRRDRGITPEVARPELKTVAASRRPTHLAADKALTLDEYDALYGPMLAGEEADLARATEPYRAGIDATEKAIRAIALLGLLRARREREDGTVIPPAGGHERLVYRATGELLPVAQIAGNHDRLVAAAKEVLPSADGTWLTLKANRGLLAETKRRIEVTAKGLVEALRAIRPPGDFLADAAGRAIDDFGAAANRGGWDPGEAGKRIFNNWNKRGEIDPELTDVVEANRRGFERNVENIGIRTSRILAETVENAFFTGRQLAREPRSFLQDLLGWRLHPNYTDLTLEAHWRAVYRKVWLVLSQDAGLRYFRQYHSPSLPDAEAGGDDRCRANDGRILTYEGWQEVAAKLGTADALDQFGMHHGCRAFWFPIPADTLADLAVHGDTASA